MSPGTASDDPGPVASQGQEETGQETQTNFPEILLGEEMLAGLKWSGWAMSRGGEKFWVCWTGRGRPSWSLKSPGLFWVILDLQEH